MLKLRAIGIRDYRGGRCDHWIKVKNRRHPAMDREL
jgi:hypothetical protein